MTKRLMAVAPSASYSFTVRLEIRNKPGMLGRVTSVIGKAGGDIGAVDLVEMSGERVLRDITIKARDSRHAHDIVDRLRSTTGVRIANISDRTFLMHLGGKIEIHSKVPIRTRDDLSMAYTPGVARVCLAIKDDPSRAFTLTIKQNAVAVVTDGTAVLGLGDIGPEAAMPVMEGKAMLFKELAGVDAFPIPPGHQGSGQDRGDREDDRPRVRGDQPGGHLGPALLRDRGAAAEGAGHPGLPRRSARHRGGGAGRAVQRAEDRQEGHPPDQGGGLRGGRRRDRDDQDPARPRGPAHHRGGRARHDSPGPRRRDGLHEDVGGLGDQSAATSRAGCPTPSRARTCSSACRCRGVLTVRDVKSMARDRIVFAMANPVPEIQPEEAERARAGDGHRPLRLPEPDQQRALLPRVLPRAARLPGRGW